VSVVGVVGLGGEVAGTWGREAQIFVWPDVVVRGALDVDQLPKLVSVGDLLAERSLVFQGAEESLDHPLT
jgi:hypothetical protein